MQNIPVGERNPFYVYRYEFQNFTTLMLANMMSELRKYGVGLTLAISICTSWDPISAMPFWAMLGL